MLLKPTFWTTIALVDTPCSKEEWERLKQRDEETEIIRARIAAKLEEQGPPGAEEPLLGDDAEGEGDSRTKFLVFCTADVPGEVGPFSPLYLLSLHL